MAGKVLTKYEHDGIKWFVPHIHTITLKQFTPQLPTKAQKKAGETWKETTERKQKVKPKCKADGQPFFSLKKCHISA